MREKFAEGFPMILFDYVGFTKRVCRAPKTVAVGIALLMVFAFARGAEAQGSNSGIRHELIRADELPNAPGNKLSAVVVELAPGARSPKHRHAGFVFAYVLSGTVRSQLNAGRVMTYRVGQSWVEPPGTEHTLTENPSRSTPARLLAVFVAPDGAQLTTYDK
jgi:quercetin dioxygenase-like cupin family protein